MPDIQNRSDTTRLSERESRAKIALAKPTSPQWKKKSPLDRARTEVKILGPWGNTAGRDGACERGHVHSGEANKIIGKSINSKKFINGILFSLTANRGKFDTLFKKINAGNKQQQSGR